MVSDTNQDGTPANYVLSDIEVILSSFETGTVTPWEYALSRPDMRAAETLLKNGFSIDDRITDMPILNWAIWQKKSVASKWLIMHGANVNAYGLSETDTPLFEAFRAEDVEMTLLLLNKSANPSRHVHNYLDLFERDPIKWLPVITALSKSLGYIPYDYIYTATKRDLTDQKSHLLDVLVKAKLPAETPDREWTNGIPSILPSSIEQLMDSEGSPKTKKQVRFLFRSTFTKANSRPWYRYGSRTHGFVVTSYVDPPTEDELLLMATSICEEFLKKECGPSDLIENARVWVDSFPSDCPEPAVKMLGLKACKLATQVTKTGNVVIYLPNTDQTSSGRYTAIKSFSELKRLTEEQGATP